MLDEGSDNALGVLVLNFRQHHKAGMALDQRGDVAVVRPHDQVALPMARNGTILDLRWAFTDRNCIFDFAQLKALLRGVPGSPDGARATQAFLQFLLQNPTGLNLEAAIDRFVQHAVFLFVRMLPFEPTSDLLRRPLQTQLPRYPWHKGALNESLQDLGRFAQSQARWSEGAAR